jgi:hypothetical protein
MARVMQRTTVVLPAGLKRRAMAKARERKISFSELVREAVEHSLPTPPKARKTRDPLWDDIPVYEGPVPADYSSNHDKYLYDEEP